MFELSCHLFHEDDSLHVWMTYILYTLYIWVCFWTKKWKSKNTSYIQINKSYNTNYTIKSMAYIQRIDVIKKNYLHANFQSFDSETWSLHDRFPSFLENNQAITYTDRQMNYLWHSLVRHVRWHIFSCIHQTLLNWLSLTWATASNDFK